MDSLPNLGALRVFEVAARHGSFARAATELHVTPAAVSRQVRRLESELGEALFERGHRHVALTDHGRRLAERVRAGFALIASFSTDGAGASGERLVLDADEDFLTTWLLPRLGPATIATLPDRLELRSRLEPPRQLPASVDVAVVFGAAEHPGYVTTRLLDTDGFVVSAPRLADGRTPPGTFDDLGAYPLLHCRDDRWWRRVYEAAGRPYPERGRSITVSRTDLLNAAAVRGLGLAIGDSVTCEAPLRDGTLVRGPGPTLKSRSFYLLHREGRLRDSERLLVDWLLEEARAANER